MTISIHTPRVGRDIRPSGRLPEKVLKFQSTRPVWGVTRAVIEQTITELRISIHTPRVGRDRAFAWHNRRPGGFQSTRPVWGVTYSGYNLLNQKDIISIHTPRVGRDDI